MTEDREAYNKLKKGIENFVRTIIDRTADKTYTSIIKKVNDDGTYNIELNGMIYESVPKNSKDVCILNETVRVVVPQGNISNIFIL